MGKKKIAAKPVVSQTTEQVEPVKARAAKKRKPQSETMKAASPLILALKPHLKHSEVRVAILSAIVASEK